MLLYARHMLSQQETPALGVDKEMPTLAPALAPDLAPAFLPALALAVEVVEEAEGLQLHLSSKSATGYKGVRFRPTTKKKSQGQGQGTFHAGTSKVQEMLDGVGKEKNIHLGSFGTAVEAAVCYARHKQSTAVAAAMSALASDSTAAGVIAAPCPSVVPAEKQRQEANACGGVPAGKRQRLAAAEAGKPGRLEEAHAIAAPASTTPASAAVPPLPPAHGGPLYALDPDGAPCRTRASVELHAALVSAQIQAELEAGQHVYAKQWARPAVQWGGVQWDRSLEIAIAAELSQPSRRRTAASQGTRRTLTSPATWSRARRGRRPAIARQPFPFSAGEASDYEGHARCDF